MASKDVTRILTILTIGSVLATIGGATITRPAMGPSTAIASV